MLTDVEDFMKREQEKLQQEKMMIMNNKNIIAEEKQKIMEEIKAKEDQLKKEKAYKEDLARTLKKMEEKLLSGDKNLIDHTTEQERRLQELRFI